MSEVLPVMKKENRPWGYYEVLADEENHKVKRITVCPGGRLSLQRHSRRSEHWYMISGEAIVTLGEVEIPFGAGQAVDIPWGTIHRILNKSEKDVIYIEIQTGDYFGEDDIERIEDDYGRA